LVAQIAIALTMVGQVTSRVVGDPYFTGLWKGCPSSAQNPKPASPGRERYRLLSAGTKDMAKGDVFGVYLGCIQRFRNEDC
jgi:hypothetical protein